MNNRLIVGIIMLLLSQTVEGNDNEMCLCSQITFQNDCESMGSISNCEWQNSRCQTSLTTISSRKYCQQFKSANDCWNHSLCEKGCDSKTDICPKCTKQFYPCVWQDGYCAFFSGCTSVKLYLYNDNNCQNYSQNCISDTDSCIQLGECTDYKSINTCKKSVAGTSCRYNYNYGCSNIVSCDQIPTSISTHIDCYNQLHNCTAKMDGGCQQILSQCESYSYQNACNITTGGQKCFWSEGTCQGIQCISAPLSYTTQQQCQNFMKTCTTKEGGGCQTIFTCDSQKTSSDCEQSVTQQNNCYWINSLNLCVIHECQNAPKSYQTLKQCQSFKEECIVNDDGNGCKVNNTCSAILTKAYCDGHNSAKGQACFWNYESICIEKTCENAPSLLTTYEQCENFLSECTTNSGVGCRQKTCNNAPSTITTNADCQKYYPNHNCITISGGGCTTNDSCSKASLAIACVKDINGQDCYWNEVLYECQTKQCEKAPSKYNTQQLCSSFLDICQVNKDSTGCETKTCENFRAVNLCTNQFDYKNQQCIWQSNCIEKKCENASEENQTFDDCQQFLPSCTLSNTGKGCMTLPLRCDVIKLQAGCYLRSSITLSGIQTTNKCAWNNGKCQDISCDTAPINLDSNILCNNYLKGCYVNNFRQGCWKLPDCQNRKLFENCQIQNMYDCVWDQENGICITRSCKTATIKAVDSPQTINFYTCNQYPINSDSCLKEYGRGCCTISETEATCMLKPNQCSQLKNQDQCTFNALLSGRDCIWNGTLCLEKSCAALNVTIYNLTYTHQNCFLQSNGSCTVGNDLNSCIDLKNNCSEYQIEDQCRIDKYQNDCVVRLNQQTNQLTCDLEQCSDVNTAEYSDFEACQQYNEACTVIARVKGIGCINRLENCFDYKFSNQCGKTLSGKSCVWNGNRCWDRDNVTCSKIVLTTYSTENCEQIAWYCNSSADNNKCQLKQCSDFKNIGGLSSNAVISALGDCLAFSKLSAQFNCSINSNLNQCTDIKQFCSDYTQQSDCYYASINKWCKFANSICFIATAHCSSFSANSDSQCKQYRSFCKYSEGQIGILGCQDGNCSDQIGSDLNHQKCQLYDTSCTSTIDGTKCMLMQSDCGSYKTSNECTQLQSFKCIWVNQQCIGVLSLKDAEINCPLKAGTSFEECQQFSLYCSVNRSKTNCIKIQQCSNYPISNCYKGSDGFCLQSKISDDESVCQSNNLVSCFNIYLGQSTKYTQQLCQSILPNCTNLNDTGCQDQTCENKTSSPFTHISCNQWNSSCTVNKDGNKCVQMQSRCKDQLVSNCIFTSQDGECEIDNTNNICVEKTCYTNLTATSDSECSLYMSTCTVAFAGGCMNRTECKSYMTQEQCVEDNLNRICYWNPTDHNCVLFSCDVIEKSTKYDTHDECYALTNVYDSDKLNYTKRCTVKINVDTSTPDGCMDLQPCMSYKNKEQCYQANDGTYCHWNTDNSNHPFCEERTCRSAPDSFNTHLQCAQYQMNVSTKYQDKCTVANNEYLQAIGCMDRAICESYKIQDQCHFNVNGIECKWNDQIGKCYTKACSAAPVAFTTHQMCNNFLSECTVNSTLSGCTQILPTCENYTVQEQCVKNSIDQLCNWNGSQCVTRACSNSPNTTDACQVYLSTCTNANDLKCKVQSCEDFSLTTNKACQSLSGLNQVCTTNGRYCVKRKSCEEALCKEACVQSAEGYECIWQPATLTSDASCLTNICSINSKNFTTVAECTKIDSSCTLKRSGGCMMISDCAFFDQQITCIKSIDGKTCGWQNGRCQSIDCVDLKGTDHFSCSKQNPKCTVSNTGQCVYKSPQCELYTQQQSCVQADDGTPCLWITGNNISGKCITYSSCQDLPFATDAECKAISQYCTTDGINCKPLEKCENLTSVNCVTGTDGDCMLIAEQQNSVTLTCKKLDCSLGSYLNQTQCEKLSPKCSWQGVSCSLNDHITSTNCLISYNYKYSWDKTKMQCLQCKTIQNSSNSNNTNTSNTSNQSSAVDNTNTTNANSQVIKGTILFGLILLF